MAGRTVKVPVKKHASYDAPQIGMRYFHLGSGFDMADLQAEIDGYLDIALGREDPTYDNGVMTMMEFANAVLARLTEIEINILRAESAGTITKGSRLYRFRTGELRSVQELFSKTQELGSRRLTYYLSERDD